MESLGTSELKEFQKQSAENAIAIASQIRVAAQISTDMQNNLSTLTATMAGLTKQASETTNVLKAQLEQPKRRKGWFSRSGSKRKRR